MTKSNYNMKEMEQILPLYFKNTHQHRDKDRSTISGTHPDEFDSFQHNITLLMAILQIRHFYYMFYMIMSNMSNHK